jgi:predicted glycoside hydrolase/deacetylase ChbG (UPF0249 family)
MKKIITIFIAFHLLFFCTDCRSQDEIRLLVRGDDIGSTHAANLGCIESYRDGIMQSVEIMVPCAWFPEAASMLQDNPGLDVGIHITLTSEWTGIKWRSLTHAPSITDEDGYFFPVIWPVERYPERQALVNQQWDIGEIEAEMRAQIETALKYIPRISHLSCHMGCAGWDESVGELYRRLAGEYGLDIPSGDMRLERFPLGEKGKTLEERIANFIGGLHKLEPGHTYLFVEHPAVACPEMEAVGHPGYENVSEDRDLVRRMFTTEAVKQVIEAHHIRLISYADLAE